MLTFSFIILYASVWLCSSYICTSVTWSVVTFSSFYSYICHFLSHWVCELSLVQSCICCRGCFCRVVCSCLWAEPEYKWDECPVYQGVFVEISHSHQLLVVWRRISAGLMFSQWWADTHRAVLWSAITEVSRMWPPGELQHRLTFFAALLLDPPCCVLA